MNIPDLILENLVSVFKFFDADPGSCQPWIWDGKFGSRINIPYPQHWLKLRENMRLSYTGKKCTWSDHFTVIVKGK